VKVASIGSWSVGRVGILLLVLASLVDSWRGMHFEAIECILFAIFCLLLQLQEKSR
jgi:hypothetical protein